MLENLQAFSGEFSAAPQLSLFLKPETSKEDLGKIEFALKENPRVAGFRFVPRDRALEQFKKDSEWSDVLDGLERNPLPDAFIVTARTSSPEALQSLHDEFAKMPAVEHAQIDSAWAKRLEALLRVGRWTVVMLAALLSFSVVAVAFNTIRLQILTMRDEIEVAKLIGATNRFVRRPFLYFGAMQGMIGGALAWLIISVGIRLMDDRLERLMELYETTFRLYHLSLEDSLSLLLFSACLGWSGAWLSAANHLGRIEPR